MLFFFQYFRFATNVDFPSRNYESHLDTKSQKVKCVLCSTEDNSTKPLVYHQGSRLCEMCFKIETWAREDLNFEKEPNDTIQKTTKKVKKKNCRHTVNERKEFS